MSKVNDLRRKATEAVRGREYDRAIDLMGKLCDLDPSNGTPRNELGDLYLKTSNTPNALDCFSLSARLYSEFGLTNNAVAVFKKILRHDPNHLDSIWGLAEIRREQGIDAEASCGFLEFLSRVEQVPEAGREGFFTRTLELIETMGDDLEILSCLEQIYESCGRSDDGAKVMIAKARQAHIEGEFEVRDRYIDHGRKTCEIFDSLPAYHDYLEEVGGDGSVGDDGDDGDAAAKAADTAPDKISLPDPGVIEIDEAATDEAFTDPGQVDDAAADSSGQADDQSGQPTVMINTESLDLGFDFETEASTDLPGEVLVEELVLDDNEPASADDRDPVAEQTEEQPAEDSSKEVVQEPAAAEKPAQESAGEEGVDLLAEILADESFNVSADEGRQVETIAEEMQGQIGGDLDASDFGGQYELGIVYMDMALFDQALAAFKAAARGENYRLASLEMQGTCLLRLSRDAEALEAFQGGLAIEGAPEKAYLGLLYGLGCCLELRGDAGEAGEYFKRVAAVDANFLDVSSKLEQAGEPR